MATTPGRYRGRHPSHSSRAPSVHPWLPVRAKPYAVSACCRTACRTCTYSSRSCRPVTSGAPSHTTRSAGRPWKWEMTCGRRAQGGCVGRREGRGRRGGGHGSGQGPANVMARPWKWEMTWGGGGGGVGCTEDGGREAGLGTWGGRDVAVPCSCTTPAMGAMGCMSFSPTSPTNLLTRTLLAHLLSSAAAADAPCR